MSLAYDWRCSCGQTHLLNEPCPTNGKPPSTWTCGRCLQQHEQNEECRPPMPRPTTAEVLMRFAEELSKRATCARAQVGAVVTDPTMMQVLGYGYNGNAKGFPNECDRTEPGNCGCLHAEMNALLKAPGVVPAKNLFTTTMPCAACAKAAINANVAHVYVRHLYRTPDGLALLLRANVGVKLLGANGSARWLGAEDVRRALPQP